MCVCPSVPWAVQTSGVCTDFLFHNPGKFQVPASLKVKQNKPVFTTLLCWAMSGSLWGAVGIRRAHPLFILPFPPPKPPHQHKTNLSFLQYGIFLATKRIIRVWLPGGRGRAGSESREVSRHSQAGRAGLGGAMPGIEAQAGRAGPATHLVIPHMALRWPRRSPA